jgi:galactitol-specific phosphotransferase system IIC component
MHLLNASFRALDVEIWQEWHLRLCFIFLLCLLMDVWLVADMLTSIICIIKYTDLAPNFLNLKLSKDLNLKKPDFSVYLKLQNVVSNFEKYQAPFVVSIDAMPFYLNSMSTCYQSVIISTNDKDGNNQSYLHGLVNYSHVLCACMYMRLLPYMIYFDKLKC